MATDFDLEACKRLPLADATLRLLDFTFNDSFLDGVFERHRGRSYEGVIAFPIFVRLIRDALCSESSAHRNFLKAQDEDALDATVQAAYGKLRRLPIQLSLGLFAEAATQLSAIASPVVAKPLPRSLAGFRAIGFDGKKLKYVAKKLKQARGLKGQLLGGKLLVAQDIATQQAIAVEAVADGQAADNPLTPALVQRVRALPDPRPRLWVGDRAFCDHDFFALLRADLDHFVVRYKSSSKFKRDESKPVRTGKDKDGRPFEDEWGWLGNAKIAVRRITVKRAGAEPVIIVTSLLDADLYPASDLLELYRFRWGIETMFQQVVQTFDLRHLIGSTPQATVFQAMLCLLLYDMMVVIRDYVAHGAKLEPAKVSLSNLFVDVVEEMAGWMKVIGPTATLDVLEATRPQSVDELCKYLGERLATVWQNRWRKAPTRKQSPKSPPRAYIVGGHTSVEKLLHGKHKEIPIKPNSTTARAGPPAEPNEDV